MVSLNFISESLIAKYSSTPFAAKFVKFDHVRYYVENAKESSELLWTRYGFSLIGVAYGGFEENEFATVSYAVCQNKLLGVEFVKVPGTYYEKRTIEYNAKLISLQIGLKQLKELNILVCFDNHDGFGRDNFNHFMNLLKPDCEVVAKAAVGVESICVADKNSVDRKVHCFESFIWENLRKEDLCVIKDDNKNITNIENKTGRLMVAVNWTRNEGWAAPAIKPCKDPQINPTVLGLHQSLTDGFKVYRGADNKIRLFRPSLSIKRFNLLARKASFPTFNNGQFLKILGELIKLDFHLLPEFGEKALYVKINIVETEARLDDSKINAVEFSIVTIPSEKITKYNLKCANLLVDQGIHKRITDIASAQIKHAPSAVGSFLKKHANSHNCSELLWLNGDNNTISQTSALHFFVFMRNEAGIDELITAPMNDQGNYYFHELIRAIEEERVYQMFGSGTLKTITPIETLVCLKDGKEESVHYTVRSKDADVDIMNKLFNQITEIQFGQQTYSDWILNL
uniref:Branched-chain-amino-acid transaminase n=1 Tax=Rhabditophanes sp. KR3021 TaxID=114890 RepID=A0AC35TSR8_9BILA